jgi:hypothetical protein
MAARDILFICVIVFAFAIGFFMMHYVIGTMVDQMVSNPTINESNASVTSITMSKTLTNRFDYVIFGLFMAFILGIIITSWFIGGHPIFMFIYFIIIVIAVVISSIMNKVWVDVTQDIVLFGNTISYFPIANHILNNFPLYMTIIGFIGLIIMFAKPRLQQQF